MGWYPHHDLSWEWLIGMALMMALFWGGLILFGIWALRALLGSGFARRDDERSYRPSSTALEILKERYARGEITRAEFEQMREDLER